MKEYKIGDIVEENEYTEAALWCRENNAILKELEPETREEEEAYTEQVPVEKEIVVPVEYDEEGTVVVEEHTETTTEYEEQEKTRNIEITVRRFEITAIPEPTIEELNEQIRIQRQTRYVAESDPIRLDYDEALAREEETAESLKQEWLASKDKIREELPYIEE